MRFRRTGATRHSELTLGTAQLGMQYGVVNDHGQPSGLQAVEIVRKAADCGVTAFDTARSYGEAESVLGEALDEHPGITIVTKLAIPRIGSNAGESEVLAGVEKSVHDSCFALNRDRLDVLLLHGWEQRHAGGGAVWRALLRLRDRGKIGALGASVYRPEEALAAIADPEFRHLQLPINALDSRWERADVPRVVMGRPEMVVHARSALLQGILAHPPARWPDSRGFDAVACARSLEFLSARFGRESVADLCLAYVRSLPWITSLVVGCETMAQLNENLRLFESAPLTAEQSDELRHILPKVPEAFLNPAMWGTRKQVACAS